MIEASPDQGKLSRRDVLRGGVKIGIGAMAVGAGLGANEAEARNWTQEDREAIQSDMRNVIDKAVKYFGNFDHQYKDSLHNSIADKLREFNKIAGGGTLERDASDKYYNGLDKQFEDVFSQTDYVGRVHRRAGEIINYIQALIKTADVSFLAFSSNPEIRKGRDELNEALSATHKKLEDLWLQLKN